MINIIEIKEILGNEHEKVKEYTFYYDETNNYRKLRIREKGLNMNDAFKKNYVLGGFVCLKKDKENVNKSINELFNNELSLYKNCEIKSCNLFDGCKNVLECLNKEQLTEILKWSIINGFIHYSTMNCFYYAITDLVDSFFIFEGEQIPFPKEYIDIMKCWLYDLINYFYRDEFIKLANEINYPNVQGNDVKILCDWLIEKMDSIGERLGFDFELLKSLVKDKRNFLNLTFLEDDENKKTIVESFFALRQQRCIIFCDSEHIFDEELTDEKLMLKYPLTKDGKNVFVNYIFENSKNYRLIQVSDIIASLIARLYEYLDNNYTENIQSDIENLNKRQKENFILLINLINKSVNEDKDFTVTVNSNENIMFRNDILEYIEKLLIEK